MKVINCLKGFGMIIAILILFLSIMPLIVAPPVVCGDGVVDGGEECDDNNTIGGDGCSSICMHDGVINICKIIFDENNQSTNGINAIYTIFNISTSWGNFSFENPLGLNEDLIDDANNTNDAQCISTGGLAIGEYFYIEEDLSQNGVWLIPLYNDLFQGSTNIPSGLRPFGVTSRADGAIGITSNRPERTFVILNQHCSDEDFDLICAENDNCPNIGNNQSDVDNDGIGDACDNCPVDFNPNQTDICSAVCGDGNVDQGELCDDGNNIDNDGCDNQCMHNALVGICKVVINEYFEIINGSFSNQTEFKINTSIANVSFTTPVLNTSDVTDIDGNDAECRVFTDIAVGNYTYDQEIISNNLWLLPKYFDGLTSQKNVSSDFSFYNSSVNSDGIFEVKNLIGLQILAILNQPTYCGDGLIQYPNAYSQIEECDDGNNINGDGCQSDCTLPILPVCGNGELENLEYCDDGNNINGDGCSSICVVERFCENQVIVKFDGQNSGEIDIEIVGLELVSSDPLHPAMIFDSGNPSGNDNDLGTPNEIYSGPGIGAGGASNWRELGNILIISKDGDINDPDDFEGGGMILFNFSNLMTLHAVTFVDIEENPAFLQVFDKNGTEVVMMYSNNTGDNGVQVLISNKSNYTANRAKVTFEGSGALDELIFCPICEDLDMDGVCDNIDMCPDSKPGAPTDNMGCDVIQFCGKFNGACNICNYADWHGNEPGVDPMDCTLGKKENEGTIELVCIPFEYGEMCAN